jgi:hypothetical protein
MRATIMSWMFQFIDEHVSAGGPSASNARHVSGNIASMRGRRPPLIESAFPSVQNATSSGGANMGGDQGGGNLEGVLFFRLGPGAEAAWRSGKHRAAFAAVAADGADAYLEGTFSAAQLRALADTMQRSLH